MVKMKELGSLIINTKNALNLVPLCLRGKKNLR
jgi:hypothetical protein